MVGDIPGDHVVGCWDGSTPCFEVVEVSAIGSSCRRGDPGLNVGPN